MVVAPKAEVQRLAAIPFARRAEIESTRGLNKDWDRWGEKNDAQRSIRIMLAAGFRGTVALEYESGP